MAFDGIRGTFFSKLVEPKVLNKLSPLDINSLPFLGSPVRMAFNQNITGEKANLDKLFARRCRDIQVCPRLGSGTKIQGAAIYACTTGIDRKLRIANMLKLIRHFKRRASGYVIDVRANRLNTTASDQKQKANKRYKKPAPHHHPLFD